MNNCKIKTCALIPEFNESDAISAVIIGVKKYIDAVIVIDDGSNDGTAQAAVAAGAVCLCCEKNQGKGAALRRGIAYSLERSYTYALFIDGDGQHKTEDIPALIQTACQTGADMVIGARTFDHEQMPLERYLSNSIGSHIASWLTGRNIKDSQSGFRLIRLDKLRLFKLKSIKYEIEMEILIKMSMAGCSIEHVPVSRVYENGKARSKMRPVRDTIRICFWSLFFRFLRY